MTFFISTNRCHQRAGIEPEFLLLCQSDSACLDCVVVLWFMTDGAYEQHVFEMKHINMQYLMKVAADMYVYICTYTLLLSTHTIINGCTQPMNVQ